MDINFFDEIKKYTPKKRSRFSGKVSDFEVGNDTGLKSGSKDLFLSRKNKMWNGVFFVVMTFLFFFTFLAESYNLQIIKGERNLSLAEGNRIRIKSMMAERGLILDRSNNILVRNKPAFSIEMNLSSCDRTPCLEMAKDFSSQFDLEFDLENIRKEIEAGKEAIVIKSGLEKKQIVPIEVFLADYPVFSVSVTPQRDYLYGEAFSHLIGYVGYADSLQPVIEGKMGVESSYNNYLSGVDGGEIVQINSSGREVGVLSEQKSIPGKDLKLYLDKDLQLLAYRLLADKVENSSAVAGAVVAQDPQTGGILSLVSYPAFDPNKMASDLTSTEYQEIIQKPNHPFFNRVISATYPPASTFKMIMASAVLMEDIVSPDYKIDDKGFIQVGSFIFRNWKSGGHGLVDLVRAIQVSNDTYFYTVGGGYGDIKGLGIDKISKWAKKFGVGRLTGIDILGEVAGFMPDGDYKDWYLGDTYITSVGQGDVLMTPLQINNLTAYFANGGKLNMPKVVRTTSTQENEEESGKSEGSSKISSKSSGESNKDVNIKDKYLATNLISPEAYDLIRRGLRLAVEPGGTAYPFFDFEKTYGIKAGGKTGTAEFGAKDNETTHAWFTVFAPFDTQKSEIVLTVFLENGGGGSDDAAPIARKLLDLWFDKESDRN